MKEINELQYFHEHRLRRIFDNNSFARRSVDDLKAVLGQIYQEIVKIVKGKQNNE